MSCGDGFFCVISFDKLVKKCFLVYFLVLRKFLGFLIVREVFFLVMRIWVYVLCFSLVVCRIGVIFCVFFLLIFNLNFFNVVISIFIVFIWLFDVV